MKSLSSLNHFLFILLILTAVFLFHFVKTGQAVYGDGKFYWSYMRSVIKDRDLDLRNELNREYNHKTNNELSDKDISNKQIFNWMPIGTSLSWFPLFMFADAIANGIHFFIPAFPNNGYSDIYQISVGIENIIFVVLGLFILYSVLRKYYQDSIAIMTVYLILFGSNVLFYGGIDVINSHPLSFLLSVLFCFLWIKTRKKRTVKQWFYMGAILGVMAMVRTQDAVFVILPCIDLLRQTKLKSFIISSSTFFFACVLFFIPQMFFWNYFFGNYFISPYALGGFQFFKPHLWEVLFNIKTGLMIWTPLYIISFMGLFAGALKNKMIFRELIILILIQFYVISSWSGWDQGRSFGIRMFISGLPYLSFGTAHVVSRIKRRYGEKSIPVMAILCIGYNLAGLILFNLFI